MPKNEILWALEIVTKKLMSLEWDGTRRVNYKIESWEVMQDLNIVSINCSLETYNLFKKAFLGKNIKNDFGKDPIDMDRSEAMIFVV